MYIPMIDAAMELQPETTKAASFNGPWLDLGENYEPGGLGSLLAGVVDVSALDTANADETYNFKLQQTDPDVNGVADDAAAADIGVNVPATAAGVVVAKGIVTKRRFIRLVLTAAGTTPSITYEAHVGK